MNITSNTNTVTTNPVIRFLVNRMPSHSKRLIYLASLTGVINGVREPDENFIKKLNEVLNLSDSGDSALKLPIYVSDLIWKNKENIEKDLATLKDPLAQPNTKKECIGRIQECTPSWLRYASNDIVEEDLCQLFKPTNGLVKTIPLLGYHTH